MAQTNRDCRAGFRNTNVNVKSGLQVPSPDQEEGWTRVCVRSVGEPWEFESFKRGYVQMCVGVRSRVCACEHPGVSSWKGRWGPVVAPLEPVGLCEEGLSQGPESALAHPTPTWSSSHRPRPTCFTSSTAFRASRSLFEDVGEAPTGSCTPGLISEGETPLRAVWDPRVCPLPSTDRRPPTSTAWQAAPPNLILANRTLNTCPLFRA